MYFTSTYCHRNFPLAEIGGFLSCTVNYKGLLHSSVTFQVNLCH